MGSLPRIILQFHYSKLEACLDSFLEKMTMCTEVYRNDRLTGNRYQGRLQQHLHFEKIAMNLSLSCILIRIFKGFQLGEEKFK